MSPRVPRVMNQRPVTGPKNLPTRAVPMRWTEKRPMRMTRVMSTSGVMLIPLMISSSLPTWAAMAASLIVAIALSTVAPIRHAAGDVLSDDELREVFYRPLGATGSKPDLDGFVIRRGDLKTAMTTLKDARVVFGAK